MKRYLFILSILLFFTDLHSQKIFRGCNLKYGVINKKKEILFPAKLDKLEYGREYLFGALNGLHGVLNRSNGEVLIDFKYDKLKYVHLETSKIYSIENNVYFISKKNNACNLLNINGQELLEESYESIKLVEDYPECYFIASKNNNKYILTNTGKYYIDKPFSSIQRTLSGFYLKDLDNEKFILKNDTLKKYNKLEHGKILLVNSNTSPLGIEEDVEYNKIGKMQHSNKIEFDSFKEYTIFYNEKNKFYGLNKGNDIIIQADKYDFLQFHFDDFNYDDFSFLDSPLLITRTTNMMYGLVTLDNTEILKNRFKQIKGYTLSDPAIFNVISDCGAFGEFVYRNENDHVLYLPEE